MTDPEIRAAWLRLKDPFAGPARLLFLLVGLGGIGAYGWTCLRADLRVPFAAAVVVVAAYYAVRSLRVRSLALRATEAEIRTRLVEDGVKALEGAPLTLVRALMWLGIGAWSWAALGGLLPFPILENRELTLFVAALGTLLGARLLLEWKSDLPRVRADLEALAAEEQAA